MFSLVCDAQNVHFVSKHLFWSSKESKLLRLPHLFISSLANNSPCVAVLLSRAGFSGLKTWKAPSDDVFYLYSHLLQNFLFFCFLHRCVSLTPFPLHFSTLPQMLRDMNLSALLPFLPGQPQKFATFMDKAIGLV